MVEFKKEQYGAVVATICENDDQVVEVQRHKDGKFSLIVHNRSPCGGWDDLTAHLTPEDFAKLGRIPDAPHPSE